MRLSESLGVAGDKAEERAEIGRAADRSQERKRSDRLG
jgi:hypothetical protein